MPAPPAPCTCAARRCRRPYVKGLGEYLRAAGYFTLNRDKTDYNISATPTADNDGGLLYRTVPLGAWDESGPQAHWRNREPGQPFFAVISPQVTHESRLFVSNEAFAKEAVHLKPGDRHDPARAALPPYYPDTPTARANWARYYDMWTEADYQVAGILRELDDDGLAANTVVIFASDHGRGFPRAKRWAYDSGVRVPLIVRWPGHLAAGAVRDDLVSFIDLPTTTLALAGVTVPRHFQGQVFLGPTRPRRASSSTCIATAWIRRLTPSAPSATAATSTSGTSSPIGPTRRLCPMPNRCRCCRSGAGPWPQAN